MPLARSDDRSSAPAPKEAARYRGIPARAWVALIGVFPSVLSSITTYQVSRPAILGDDDRELEINKVQGDITSPAPGKMKRTIPCSGTVENLKPDLHPWLAVEVDGCVWCKEGKFEVESNHSNWTCTIRGGGESDQTDFHHPVRRGSGGEPGNPRMGRAKQVGRRV